MRRLLEDLGAEIEERHGAELQYHLPVRAAPEDYPATHAGDAFRAAHALAGSA
jgi:hypothetical protein